VSLTTLYAAGDRVIFVGPHVATHVIGQKGTVLEESDGYDHLGNQHYWVSMDGDPQRRSVWVANLHFVALSAVDRLAELA
jgi:hypothetical protein